MTKPPCPQLILQQYSELLSILLTIKSHSSTILGKEQMSSIPKAEENENGNFTKCPTAAFMDSSLN
ncbi:hypothetical protein EG68_06584 [Paragonimus skrjabini miyazakii]|uniref:Uncharacterized protein n=1 Tax=Paragonimus skrjabini miyazakii TaxID=59628 RepID=A0A8S9YNL3_9TREM|nr:hypothetical protein EG68_06584 [Paragonimus skrjabini miyazakii]